MSDYTYLEAFKKQVSSRISISEFLQLTETVQEQVFSSNHFDRIRMGDRANKSCPSFKEFVSEIIPVKRYLRFKKITEGEIQFSMSSDFPDCTVFLPSEVEDYIEVTSIRNRAQIEKANALNSKEVFSGISRKRDRDKPSSSKTKPARNSYSTNDVLELYKSDIESVCARKMNHSSKGTLLIGVREGMESLRTSVWFDNAWQLAEPTIGLHFESVFLVGRGPEGDICLTLKEPPK